MGQRRGVGGSGQKGGKGGHSRGVDVEVRVEAGRRGAPRVALQAQRSMHPPSSPFAAAVADEPLG